MMKTEIKTEPAKQEKKIPYEKPELSELGSVTHVTAEVSSQGFVEVN